MAHITEQVRQRRRHAERYWAIARSGEYDDVPCKIETDAQGDVVKEPPPSFHHKAFQWRIRQLLARALPGVATTEFPVATQEGTKLPDVVWITGEAWDQTMEDETSLPVPRICVEVLSSSNSTDEMREKRRLYFDIGVEEVWICDRQGYIRVFSAAGRVDTSRFVADIPVPLDITSRDDRDP